MKSFLLVLSLLVIAACSSKKDTIADTHETTAQLTHKFSNGEAYLIDVRTPEEFQEGHLKYASNVNFKSSEFKNIIGKLDKNKPVYLYCKKGNRSKKATDTLNTLGFTKAYNIGGLEELKASGLEVEQ